MNKNSNFIIKGGYMCKYEGFVVKKIKKYVKECMYIYMCVLSVIDSIYSINDRVYIN